jgi:hypothetical protein
MVKVALLRAAEEVFSAHGLDDALVEEIARRAGVSKGSFYLHFAGKEDAFKEVTEGFLARFAQMVPSPENYSQLPAVAARVGAFIEDTDLNLFEFLWQNRDFVRIVGASPGRFAYVVESFEQTLIEASRAWLAHWQRVGLVRPDVDVQTSARLIVGAYQGLARAMVAEKKRPPIEAWIADAVGMFYCGVGTAPLVRAMQRRRAQRASQAAAAPVRAPSRRRTGGAK